MNLAGFYFNLTVELPVLTNTVVVERGDLLVLPFDGGCSRLKNKEDVANYTDSFPEQSEFRA